MIQAHSLRRWYKQFRAGSYETCSLTTHRRHREAVFDLIIPAYLCSVTALADIQSVSPYHRPLTEEDSSRGSPVTFQTRFGTLSTGLRTDYTAQARPRRDWQEHARYSSIKQHAEYTEQCDFVSHHNDEVSSRIFGAKRRKPGPPRLFCYIIIR